MIGWNVSVYRQADGGAWQTRGHGGLQWFHDLAQAGNAIDLGGGGYPNRYTERARFLIPKVIDDSPSAKTPWLISEGDIILDGWVGKTLTDPDASSLCSPDEWLLVIAWDES